MSVLHYLRHNSIYMIIYLSKETLQETGVVESESCMMHCLSIQLVKNRMNNVCMWSRLYNTISLN
jgi:hypothetical protein